jgi:predicted transcriptional regulator
MKIGQQIKATREQLGLFQSDLAKLTGLKQCHISKIENNKTDPKVSTLQLIVSTLNKNRRNHDSLVIVIK